jgi:hypothetical protein
MSSLNVAYDASVNIGIEPNAHGAGTVAGNAVDCQDFDEALVILHAGVVGTSIDCKMQESVDSAFTSPVDISGATFTQILTAGDQVIVKARVKLTGSRLRYLRMFLTVTTSASDVSGCIILFRGGKAPYGTLDFNV